MRSHQKTDTPNSAAPPDESGRIVALPQRNKTGQSPEQHKRGATSRLIRRINLDLPEKPAEHLDWLQDETGAISTAEVIRSALKLYYGLAQEVKAGGTILLKTGDGTEKEIKIFI